MSKHVKTCQNIQNHTRHSKTQPQQRQQQQQQQQQQTKTKTNKRTNNNVNINTNASTNINIIIVNMIIVVLAVTKYPSTSDTCKTCEKLQWAKPDRHQGRRTCACHPVFPSPQSQPHTYRSLPLLSVTLLLAAHVHVHNPMQRIEAR
jgi:hypothetical protein